MPEESLAAGPEAAEAVRVDAKTARPMKADVASRRCGCFMEPLNAMKFDGAECNWAEQMGSPELLFQMRRRVCRVRRESAEVAE